MEDTLSVILRSLLYSWCKRYSRPRVLQTLPLHSSGFLIKENQIRNPIKNIFLKFFKQIKSSSGTASLKMMRSIMIYAKNTAVRHFSRMGTPQWCAQCHNTCSQEYPSTPNLPLSPCTLTAFGNYPH